MPSCQSGLVEQGAVRQLLILILSSLLLLSPSQSFGPVTLLVCGSFFQKHSGKDSSISIKLPLGLFEGSLMMCSYFHSKLSKALHQRKQILFPYILHQGKIKHRKMK